MPSLLTEPGITIRLIFTTRRMHIPSIVHTQCHTDMGSFYNTSNGSYGSYQTAYGPYGSATRAASYNPYTGTYKPGAFVQLLTAGKLGQAYNPYTGTYAATRQGSSPPTGVVGSILCVERK